MAVDRAGQFFEVPISSRPDLQRVRRQGGRVCRNGRTSNVAIRALARKPLKKLKTDEHAFTHGSRRT